MNGCWHTVTRTVEVPFGDSLKKKREGEKERGGEGITKPTELRWKAGASGREEELPGVPPAGPAPDVPPAIAARASAEAVPPAAAPGAGAEVVSPAAAPGSTKTTSLRCSHHFFCVFSFTVDAKSYISP